MDYNSSDMKEQIIAWSMEWEGCLSLSKSKRSRGYSIQYTPTATLDNTRRELIEAFQQLVGYGKIYCHRRYRVGNQKDCYKWQVTNLVDIKRFCEMILPHLITKKRNAELLIEFCYIRLNPAVRKGVNYRERRRTWGEREEEIYLELKELNRKGVTHA